MANLLSYPLETVRVRLAVDAGRSIKYYDKRGMFHCMRRIMAEEGLKGFYRGAHLPLIWYTITASNIWVWMNIGGLDPFDKEDDSD